MNLDYLMELVNAKVNDDARRAGVWSLGSLRTALAAFPPETPVVVDVGGSPSAIDSYRGYYDRLALETTDATRTAAEVIALLDGAEGETFYGYKGGEYDMDASTFVHVAPHGDCGPYVSGVRVEDESVVIETEEEVW